MGSVNLDASLVGRVMQSSKSRTGFVRIVGFDPQPNPSINPWRLKAVEHRPDACPAFYTVVAFDAADVSGGALVG